jgi:hypothetical protein
LNAKIRDLPSRSERNVIPPGMNKRLQKLERKELIQQSGKSSQKPNAQQHIHHGESSVRQHDPMNLS